MLIPKIIFKYSWVYDEIWKNKFGADGYPSSKQILSYIKRAERLWRKDENKVLTELSKISGLQWKSKFISCYVVGWCVPFSDPMTLPIYKYIDYFVDFLIHELIHNLFTQKGNLDKSKKSWGYFYRKYNKETETTIIHVPLYAIHSRIYLKFYNKKRLNKDMKLMKYLPDYKRAWDIVQKEGYNEIIKEFTKRIKK